MKYVRHSRAGFVLFPDMTDLFHRHVGDALLKEIPGDLISAGFATFDYSGNKIVDVRCHGRSDSLDMDSLPGDSALLAQQLGLQTREVVRLGPPPSPASRQKRWARPKLR